MVRRLPWLRLLAEGATMIVSILGALAIDAWWDRRQDLVAEQDVLSGLERELAENLDSLNATIAAAELDHAAVRQLLGAGPAGFEELDPNVLETIVTWATEARFFTRVDDFQASIQSSGQLTLIQSREITAALAGLSRLFAAVDQQNGQIDQTLNALDERYLDMPGFISRVSPDCVWARTSRCDLVAEARGAYADQRVVDLLYLRLGREQYYLGLLEAVRSHMESLLGLISRERNR